MIFSLFPLTALAEGETTDTPEPVVAEETATTEPTVTPEPTAVPEETPMPEDAVTPEPVVTPEPAATEALASESPLVEALFLRFIDCDTLDADGTGHVDVPCLAGDSIELKTTTETNGALSYRWQVLDQSSTAEDPYVDISTSDEPTADEKALSVLVDAAMLDVADYFRCVVTATSGDESVVSYCYFTLKSSDAAASPTPDLSLLPEGLLDTNAEGAAFFAPDFASLKSALASSSSYTDVYCDGTFNITENLTIPSGKTLTVVSNNHTLTIDSGKTVTNNGSIDIGSMGYLNVNGTLLNAGTVSVYSGGSMTVGSGGAYTESSSSASLIYGMIDTSTIAIINGVDTSNIYFFAIAYDESDLATALSYAGDGYLGADVFLETDTAITYDMTIPSGATLWLDANLTINSGVTLTVAENGALQVPSGMTLINNGVIDNNGYISVDGTLTNNGSIAGGGTLYNPVTVSTEAKLRAAIAAGKTDITVSAAFTLGADLTIPSGVTLTITGVTLTVPIGKTVEVDGEIDLNSSGRLLIKSGATLINYNWIQAISGSLVVETGGNYITDYSMLWLYTNSGAAITGIDKSLITVCDFADTDAQLRAALAYGGKGYGSIQMYVTSNITLASNFALTSEMMLYVGFDGDGVTLTVPTGKTLTNNGYVEVRTGNTLKINAGGTFANNGSTVVNGTYQNDGALTGDGDITTGDETIDSWSALYAAVQARRTNILISGNVTLGADLVIPRGTTVFLNDSSASLTVPAGYSLTVNGSFILSSGLLEVLTDGGLVNNNSISISGGTLRVNSGATFANYATVDLWGDGAAAIDAGGYTYSEDASFSFTDSEGATLSGISLESVYYYIDVNDAADLAAALDKSADGYQTVQINLYADASLPAGSSIGQNVQLYVGSGITLTIDSGDAVSLSGMLMIESGATLVIESGAELIIEEGAALNINGELQNSGTITGYGDFGFDIASDAALRVALANGATNLNITGSFSLLSNFTLPDYAYMNISGATLTVPTGKTLTLDGGVSMDSGYLTVATGGKLINNNSINVMGSSTLTVATGATYTQADYAYIWVNYNEGVINGILKSKITCGVYPETESALRTALALVGYRELNVFLNTSVTLSANLTIPASAFLYLEGSSESPTTLAVPSGKTLTCAGNLTLLNYSVLDIRAGGTLQMSSTGTLGFVGGELIATGTVVYADGSNVYRLIYTEDDLINAIATDTTQLLVVGDITLTDNLVIPDTMSLELVNGGTLTVPTGKTLSFGANHLWVTDGTLTVESGGALDLADGGEINISGSGSFVANGTLTFGGDNATIIFNDTGASSMTGVTGDACDHTTAHIWASNTAELIAALGKYADSPYQYNEVYLSNSLSLTGNVTIPNAVQLWVDGGYTLTVPSGVTLTIAVGGELRVEDTGNLIVNGTLVNNGQGELALNNATINGTVLDNTGNLWYSTTVSTFAQLKAAIDTGKTPLIIWGGGFTITSNLTIPDNVNVWFDPDATVTIAAGVTVTNNGIFGTHSTLTNAGTLVNNSYFKVETYGTFINNGTFVNNADADVYGAMVNNGTVTVKTGTRVRFYADATKAGTNSAGTWYSLEGQLATGIEIVGPAYIGIGEDLTQQYLAQMLPSDAWPVDVHWSIVSGGEYATILEETGELTGTAKGDVVIRATALDGSGVYGEMTVHVVNYAVVISGASGADILKVVSGKSIQLTGSFVPSNLTGSTIVWSLADGDSAYASVSTSGLVLAKAVTEQHTITVIASAADSAAESTSKEITIYPALTGIQILNGGEVVTGTTLVLNSNSSDTLTFTSAMIPTDAMTDMTWTLSATSAATMDTPSDGSAIITPVAGKAQLVTLTAKANDGSGKTASVKIQITSLSSGITINNSEPITINGGGKTQLTAAFTDPQPTNTAIKWYLAPEYDAYATLTTLGLLTAKAVTEEVTVYVQAIPADGGTSSDPYPVTIKPLATSVTIQKDEDYVTNSTLTIDLRGTTELQLTAKTWPESTSGEVVWKSSAPLVASVDADTGLVTGLTLGSAVITAVAQDGSNRSASVIVKVTSLAQNIGLYGTDLVKPVYALRGGTGTSYRVVDSDTNQLLLASAIRWTMDSAYAPYAVISSSGILTTYPVSKVTTITLGAEVIGNEETANLSFDVTIYPAAQSMALYNGTSLQTGAIVFDTFGRDTSGSIDPVTLTAPILPADSQQDVTWTSSNVNIAQVTDGVITPVWNGSGYNKGIAIITAKANDGSNVATSVKVVVTELVQGITLAPSDLKIVSPYTLTSGLSMQLKATLDNPLTATNKVVYYEIVEGSQYATISGSGLLTAKQVSSEKTVIIQARSADGNAVGQMTLTINPKSDDPLYIQSQDGTIQYSESEALYLLDISGGVVSRPLEARGMSSDSLIKVTWSVAPSYVASVTSTGDGLATLKTLTAGTAVVTAKAADGRTASFTIEVYKPATSLTITPPTGMDVENLTLASGKTMLFTGVIAPTTGVSTKGTNWYLNDAYDSTENDYATISASGLLTAKSGLTEPVTIYVYAQTKNAPYLEATPVKVILQPVATGVDILSGGTVINNQTITMSLSEPTLALTAAVYPADANSNVVWTSSNKLLATVAADGTVTGLKPGTVTIKATAADGSGKYASFKLVLLTRVEGMTITSKTGFDMRSGATLQLGITFSPTTPTDKRVTWTLSAEDAQYATLSAGGLVTAKALTSERTITVMATSVENPDVSTTQDIVIHPATTKVEILNSESEVINGMTLVFDLNAPDSKQLVAQNLPTAAGGALQSVVWKSSLPSVLKVSSDGVIEPVYNALTGRFNAGTVTITATATDGSGKYATVKVVVGYLVNSLTFADGLSVKGGKTLALKPVFDPLYATNKTLKWTIKASDAPYATVSSTGLVTAKLVTAEKIITIYCAAQDGSGVVQEVQVTITP